MCDTALRKASGFTDLPRTATKITTALSERDMSIKPLYAMTAHVCVFIPNRPPRTTRHDNFAKCHPTSKSIPRHIEESNPLHVDTS